MIPDNRPHLTSFDRLIPRPRCHLRLRLRPPCTASHRVRIRESQRGRGHPTASAAKRADANCNATVRPAVVAAAAKAPPTAAEVIQPTFVRVGVEFWVQVPLVLRAKKCTQDTPQQVYASQTRVIEERLDMDTVLTSPAALHARVGAERDHSTTGPREKHSRGRP